MRGVAAFRTFLRRAGNQAEENSEGGMQHGEFHPVRREKHRLDAVAPTVSAKDGVHRLRDPPQVVAHRLGLIDEVIDFRS